jgi:hypothetical protein
MEEEKENVVEETTPKNNQGDPGDENVVKVDKSKFESAEDDSVIKVDLSKPPTPKEENETKKDNADDGGVVAEPEDAESTQEQEEVQPEAETQEAPVLEEITEDSTEEEVAEVEEQIEEAVAEAEVTGKPLPENIQKLMDFMEETGGDLNDYVKLNQDYSKLEDSDLLYEYYKQTKPHLNSEEINFMLEDKFSWDEEEDEEIDIRRKKLALKEQVANAKSHLDGQKSKYYEEIKAGSKLTNEQQKAVDFFNRYNKDKEVAEKQTQTFNNKTNQVFNDDFKGFEYKVGDKRYRFNVKNPNEVKDSQSNINNFVKKFLNKNNEMQDATGYHKSLFTAMNPDAIANHFYEQGKADAMKQSIAATKNISMDPRKGQSAAPQQGTTYRSVDADGQSVKWGFKKRK